MIAICPLAKTDFKPAGSFTSRETRALILTGDPECLPVRVPEQAVLLAANRADLRLELWVPALAVMEYRLDLCGG